jgi:DNA-directed RNA polymerase subunit RPC12/RpoP
MDAHTRLCREVYFRPRKTSLHRVAKYAAQAGIAEADAEFAAMVMRQAREAGDTELAAVLTRTPPWSSTDELVEALRVGMPEFAHGVCPICGDIVALYAPSYAMPPPCGHKLLCASCAQRLGEQAMLEPELGEMLRDALCPYCGDPNRRSA